MRVIPGDPESSYLIQKLEGARDRRRTDAATRGPYLTAGQIAIIRRWTELGASERLILAKRHCISILRSRAHAGASPRSATTPAQDDDPDRDLNLAA